MRCGNRNTIDISVIVPVYNVEKYLRKCLDSLVNQKDVNYEIICIDDGSTDNSSVILECYKKLYKNLKVYTKKNSGLASTRNYGMQYALGEYIYFIDSDDMLSSNMCLSIFVKEMHENSLDVLYFDAKTVYEDTDTEKRLSMWYEDSYTSLCEYGMYKHGYELMREWLQNNDYVQSACMKCYRKDFLIEHEIKFPEGILHEDNLFTFKCMLFAGNVKHVKKTFYLRLIRSGGITQQIKKWSHFYGLFFSWYKMLDILVQYDIQPKYLDAAVAVVDEVRQQATNVYSKLSSAEKACQSKLKEHEKYFFKMMLSAKINIAHTVNEQYYFPYHLFKKNEKILLYGAGDVGSNFYFQAKKSKYVEIVGIVDKNAEKLSTNILPVEGVVGLVCTVYDKILIAIKDENIAKSIRDDLISMGVDRKCIVWDGENYDKKFFEQNIFFPLLENASMKL